MNATSSSWRHVADALPLRAWSEAQRDAVAGIVSQSVRDWEQAWGLPAPREPVRCAPEAAKLDPSCWQLAGSRGAAHAWYDRLASFEDVLAHALWGAPPGEAPIARAVQGSCARDLPVRLSAALRLAPPASADGEPVPQGGPWSGALMLALPWPGRILLDVAAVESLLGGAVAQTARARALVPLEDALAGRGLTVRLHLSDCDIAVGALGELQVGDVVRLRHPLHAPLQLRDADGHGLAEASLARCGRFKSAQLAAPSPATSMT